MMSGKFRNEKGLWLKCLVLPLLFSLPLSFIISCLDVSAAAEYPTKPIQIIVAASPGGGSDLASRIISPKISALLKQSVLVVCKPGAAGATGVYAAMAAPPDGYTILLGSTTLVNLPFTVKGVAYDFLRDFTLINLSVTTPIVISVKKDAPWQSLEELIADAKKNPGKLTYGSGAVGSTAHFAGELFKLKTGTDITHIPTGTGTGQVIPPVLGGHINIGFFDLGMVFKLLEAGSLRGLAVMDRERLKQLPDIPTAVEKGFPDLNMSVWFGFSVRSETPRAIVERLEKVFKEALTDKEVIEKYENTGQVVENLGSEEATRFATKEFQKLLEVAKAANLIPK